MIRLYGIQVLRAPAFAHESLRSMPKNPLNALVKEDRNTYFWIKKKLHLSEYQMGALVWLSGLILGIVLGVWLG